jgi:hypothetical protein
MHVYDCMETKDLYRMQENVEEDLQKTPIIIQKTYDSYFLKVCKALS